MASQVVRRGFWATTVLVAGLLVSTLDLRTGRAAPDAGSSPSAAPSASAPASEDSPHPLPEKVVFHLKHGDFSSALAGLRGLGDAEAKLFAEAVERLGYAITLLELAEESARRGHRSEVTSLLDELSKIEIPGADPAFKEGAARVRGRLNERLREGDAPRDRAKLELAKKLVAEGDLDGADAVYKPFLDTPENHRSDLVREAERGSDAVGLARTPWKKELSSLRSSLRTAAQWVLALLLAWLVIRAIRSLLNRFPHDKPSIELTESAGDGKSSAATRDVVDRLLSEGRAPRGPAIDAVEDLDRSGLANISLSTEDADVLKDIASSTERISVMGLSFTPQQLYSLILPFRRPCSPEFTGTLASNDGTYAITLRERRGSKLSWFTCEAPTRAELIAETADYIAFRTTPWHVSDSWPSFRAYRKALRVPQAVGVEESKEWNTARELLEQALAFDPYNVAARYRLGVMLRRIGRNDDAATQLARLRATLSNHEAADFPAKFVKRNRHFMSSVCYDLALCYAKQDGFDDLNRAERLFAELDADSARSGGGVPNRFAILGYGSLAAVTAGRMCLESSAIPRAEREAWRKKRGKELLGKIVELRKRIDACRSDSDLQDASAASSAWAVAMAAEGRGLSLLNDKLNAEKALRAARAENPNLACASIHLAQILEDSDDDDEALVLLKRALELSPRNARAYHLLAQIHHKRGDDEAAVGFLEKARTWGRSAAVDMLYGACLRGLGRQDEALDMLARSIRTIKKGRVDYRYQLFLDILSSRPTQSARFVEVAERCFELIEAHPKAVNYEKCLEYMIEMKLRPPSAAPEPAAPAAAKAPAPPPAPTPRDETETAKDRV